MGGEGSAGGGGGWVEGEKAVTLRYKGQLHVVLVDVQGALQV